jgi:hypothetical protein
MVAAGDFASVLEYYFGVFVMGIHDVGDVFSFCNSHFLL